MSPKWLEEPDVLGEVGKDPELELPSGEREEQGKDYVLDDAERDDEDEEAGGGDGQVMDSLEIEHVCLIFIIEILVMVVNCYEDFCDVSCSLS